MEFDEAMRQISALSDKLKDDGFHQTPFCLDIVAKAMNKNGGIQRLEQALYKWAQENFLLKSKKDAAHSIADKLESIAAEIKKL